MKLYGSLAAAIILCALAGSASADNYTLKVPQQYPKIQDAIDHAGNGYVIIVSPGTYRESIHFGGKGIRLESTDPQDQWVVATTIIRPPQGRAVYFEPGTRGAALAGFTITGGDAPTAAPRKGPDGGPSGPGNGWGGGILCDRCSPNIRDNIVRGNTAGAGYSRGGGNGVAGFGGGICCMGPSCTAVIRNNIFRNNGAAYGGAIACIGGASPNITMNTLFRNSGRYGGGIYAAEQCAPDVNSDIIVSCVEGAGIYAERGASTQVTYCDSFENAGGNWIGLADPTGGNTNIMQIPMFANSAHRVYGLQSQYGRWTGSAWVRDSVTSPCIGTGRSGLNMGFEGGSRYRSKGPGGR